MSMPKDISFITDEAKLRAMHPQPMSRATDKVLTALDRHCRAIIARSPFILVATQGEGGADVSPKGDPPGFVQILDDGHILIPDRIGNNRLDGMVNLLENPRVGLLFVVPGMGETLRINGTGRITDDARLLEACAIQGKPPRVGILVEIHEAYLHCAKAFKRSELWNPDSFIDRSDLPSYAAMLLEQVQGLTEDENARQDAVMAKRGLY